MFSHVFTATRSQPMSQSDNNNAKCPYHSAPSPEEGAQQQRELSTTPKQKHGDDRS